MLLSSTQPSSMRDMESVPVRRGSLDFLYSIRKRKKKTLRRITGKFRGRRDGSLRCSRSDQRFLLPIIRRHPSSFPTMNPKADHRSIDSRARSIRRLRSRRTPAELVNGSSQFPSCEIYPSKNHLLFGNFSAAVFFLLFSFLFLLFSFYLSFYCCCSCYVILL